MLISVGMCAVGLNNVYAFAFFEGLSDQLGKLIRRSIGIFPSNANAKSVIVQVHKFLFEFCRIVFRVHLMSVVKFLVHSSPKARVIRADQ